MRLRVRAERDRDERGFTVVELMIVLSILMLVIGIITSSLWQAQKAEVYTRGRTEALDGMRSAINRMTKDLRQAYAINNWDPLNGKFLDVNTYVNGTQAHVVYDMSGGTLTRTRDGGSPVVIQKGLVNASIFEWDPDAPSVVKIVFAVKPANLPDTTLTLEAEVRFRNVHPSS